MQFLVVKIRPSTLINPNTGTCTACELRNLWRKRAFDRSIDRSGRIESSLTRSPAHSLRLHLHLHLHQLKAPSFTPPSSSLMRPPAPASSLPSHVRQLAAYLSARTSWAGPVMRYTTRLNLVSIQLSLINLSSENEIFGFKWLLFWLAPLRTFSPSVKKTILFCYL